MKSLSTSRASQAPRSSWSPLPSSTEVLGFAKGNNCENLLVVRLWDSGTARLSHLPVSDLVTGERRALATLLAEAGHFNLTDRAALKEIACAMLAVAQAKRLILLSGSGFHEIDHDRKRYQAYVLGDYAYWFGDKPRSNTVVVPSNCVARHAGTLHDWQVKIGRALSKNYYLLVTHTHALSAAVRRVFEVPPLTLVLVGPSGVGKTTAQYSAQSLIGPVSGVRTMSGTPAGIRELLAENRDVPVYFQDTRQLQTSDLIDLIFDAGDGAARMVSGKAKIPLAATLILSNERHIVDMPRSKSLMLDEGLFARCLEIACIAPHGVFHDIHDAESPAAFAKQLERDSRECYGTVWPVWIKALSEKWPNILRLHAKWLPKVREKLYARIGDYQNVRVINRVLDGLIFSAWVGVIASELKILPITKNEVVDAYAHVFLQSAERHRNGATPLATQLFDKLKRVLAESGSKFDDLTSFNQADGKSGLLGYQTQHKKYGRLYLFLPHIFCERFVAEFGSAAYSLLAEAGHLVTTKNRGYQLQIRIPGTENRASFVAVREAIRYD